MKSKLRRALHDLLIKDDISLETSIVNDLLCQMIGIELKENIGFNFRVYAYQTEDERILFNVKGLKYPDLMKCLDFFKIPDEQYVAGESLTLDNSFALEKLYPNFAEHYQSFKEKTQYRVKSRPILASSAINTINTNTAKALEAINAVLANSDEPHDSLKSLRNSIFILDGNIKQLGKFPQGYKLINEMSLTISLCLHSPEIAANEELKSALKLIVEGIVLFAGYNRYESVIANGKFKKEIEPFVNAYAITASKCDVVEDTLLRLAGASLGPKREAQWEQGDDKSRLVFTFTDMTKENAQKFVDYFVAKGDETATLGYGSRQYGSTLPQSGSEACFSLSAQSYNVAYEDEPEEVVESHSIEVDGEFFYNTIFPVLKDEIRKMDFNAETFVSYKKASEAYLALKGIVTPKTSDNKSSFFQQVQCDEEFFEEISLCIL